MAAEKGVKHVACIAIIRFVMTAKEASVFECASKGPDQRNSPGRTLVNNYVTSIVRAGSQTHI